MTKVLLPSLTCQQVEYLIKQAETVRYKAIISLFADSGIRLTELVNIKASHIDWESLDMVLRYTRSVRFEDSLNLYRKINR